MAWRSGGVWRRSPLARWTVVASLSAAVAGCGLSTANVRAEWVLARAPTGTTIDLEVFVGRSTCVDYDRVEVDERDDVVRIDAYVWQDANDSCSEDFAVHEVTVELDRPLGDRTVTGCADDRIRARGWGLPPGTDCLAAVTR